MKKYFIIALAALGFAACAEKISDGPSPEQTGELEQSYIAINLMSSELDTRVNTDTPTLEDGDEVEREVYSVHFFFFRQGVPFAVNASGSAPGGDKNWLTATPNPKFDKDTEDANISDYSEVTLVLNNYKGQYPDQIVAVINWTPSQNEYSLEKLHTELVSLKSNEDGFVMSNSVYMSDNKDVVDATSIAKSNIGKDASEARSHPVDIYVERVAAKVKVSTPAESDSEGNWDKEKDWFYTGKTSGLITLGDALNKVYVKINNWSLYNARTQSDLLKTINTTWSDADLGLTWNDIPRFRSYWAAAEAYTGGKLNDNNFIWNEGKSLGSAEYCGENTTSTETERTKLILKGQLVDQDGNAFELVKWNGQEMVKVENLKKAVAAQLKYLVYSYTEDNGEKTYTSISYEDIECISGTEDSAPENVKNYQVYFQLTSTASGKKWATKSGETYKDKDASQINSYLVANIPAATVYADGHTYYYIDIKHLGTSGKGAEYGIVRNHIYDIEIQSIKGYGTPVYSPDSNLVKPETPTDEQGVYVAAKINVLSWRVVKQGVDIVQ